MRDIDYHRRRAIARPAFRSPGQAEAFIERNCLGAHRKGFKCHRYAPGCPLISVALGDVTPREWHHGRCAEYESYAQRSKREKAARAKAIEESHVGPLFDVTPLVEDWNAKHVERDKF